jgi:hypothetical protein
MSAQHSSPPRSTWELVEAILAEEEREIDGLSREELVARYVEAGIDAAEVEAHVDGIMKERESRELKAERLERPSVRALSPEQLDGELREAGIEPESLRRIARQVFADFGVEDSPASERGAGPPPLSKPPQS